MRTTLSKLLLRMADLRASIEALPTIPEIDLLIESMGLGGFGVDGRTYWYGYEPQGEDQ